MSRALRASGFIVVGRVTGLFWVALLTAKLGVAEFGTYAIATAGAGLIAGTADSYFYARTVRVDSETFTIDQRLRNGLGLLATALGLSLLAAGLLVVGFAIAVAGAELTLSAWKARHRRVGSVHHEQRLDLTRQSISIVAAAAGLVFADIDLRAAMLLYCLGYAPSLIRAMAIHPSIDCRVVAWGEWRTLSLTASIGAMYAQLDIIVIGVVAGATTAGVYSLASLVAWAIASFAQQYANSNVSVAHSRDRASSSRIWKRTALLGVALGAAALIGGAAILLVLPEYADSGRALAVMSPFVLMRAVNWWNTLVLTVARLDSVRLFGTGIAAFADLVLLLVLHRVGFSEYAAPVAAVVAELLLFIYYGKRVAGVVRSY